MDAIQAKSAKKFFFFFNKKKRKDTQFIPEEEEEKKKKSIGSYQWAVVRGRDKGAAAGREFGC